MSWFIRSAIRVFISHNFPSHCFSFSFDIFPVDRVRYCHFKRFCPEFFMSFFRFFFGWPLEVAEENSIVDEKLCVYLLAR